MLSVATPWVIRGYTVSYPWLHRELSVIVRDHPWSSVIIRPSPWPVRGSSVLIRSSSGPVWGWSLTFRGLSVTVRGYAGAAPWLHRGCTVAAPWLHRGCTVAAPWLNRGLSRSISPGSHGTTHGLLPDLPDYPRTTHGLDTERHGWATDYDLPRIAPDVLNFFKHPGDTKDDHGSPRIAKDQPRIPRDELGNCQGSPRIARDRSSDAIRRPIRGSVTGAKGMKPMPKF